MDPRLWRKFGGVSHKNPYLLTWRIWRLTKCPKSLLPLTCLFITFNRSFYQKRSFCQICNDIRKQLFPRCQHHCRMCGLLMMCISHLSTCFWRPEIVCAGSASTLTTCASHMYNGRFLSGEDPRWLGNISH